MKDFYYDIQDIWPNLPMRFTGVCTDGIYPFDEFV